MFWKKMKDPIIHVLKQNERNGILQSDHCIFYIQEGPSLLSGHVSNQQLPCFSLRRKKKLPWCLWRCMVMGFEQFQVKFCAGTVALRRMGSDHYLWSWRLLQVGSPSLAFLGHLVKVHDRPASGWRTGGLFHSFQGKGTASPW